MRARLPLRLAALLLAAPVAAQSGEALSDAAAALLLERRPARWRVSYEELDLPGEDLGLVGLHYDLLAPFAGAPGVFVGLGGYGALAGDRGGFFVGGLSAGWRRALGSGFAAELGGFAGGGGGADAPQGDGLMLRPHAALAKELGPFGLRLELARTDFPGGDLEGTRLTLGLELDAALATARVATADDAGAPLAAPRLRRVGFEPSVTRLEPTGGSRRRDGARLDDPLTFAGFRLRGDVSERLYLPLDLWGAVDGEASGYAAALGGVGWSQPLVSASWRLELELLAGMGGGGDVDTGGGFLWSAGAGLRWRASPSVSASVGYARLDAPDGAFTADAWRAGVAWDPLAATLGRGDGARARLAGEDFELDPWRLEVLHKTYLPGSGARRVGGGEHEPALHLLGVGLAHPLGAHAALTGRAYGAWGGDAGGYAEGLVGVEASCAPFAAHVEHELFAAYELGAAGGGGVDVGGGLVHQASAGWRWRPRAGLALSLGGGYFEPLGDGTFDAVALQLALSLDVGRAVARR